MASQASLLRQPSSRSPDRGGTRLQLLDAFELLRDGVPVPLPLSAQRLLAFVALQSRRLLRVHVAGMLWLDVSEERAFANLRSALWRLRQCGLPLIDATSTSLGLDASVEVDVHDAAALARRLIAGEGLIEGSPGTSALGSVLLPDWYDDWVLMDRERYRQLTLHALEALANRLAACGRYGEAAEAALLAIAGEPLRESAHRTLIGVHLAEGNRSEALKQYERYRDLLQHQLGLSPSQRMAELCFELTQR